MLQMYCTLDREDGCSVRFVANAVTSVTYPGVVAFGPGVISPVYPYEPGVVEEALGEQRTRWLPVPA